MIKKIFIFSRGNVAGNSLNVFSREVANYFEKKQTEVIFVDRRKIYQLAEAAKSNGKPLCDAVLIFNACGEQEIKFYEKNLFDFFDVPFFNYIVDHPMEHIYDLEHRPKKYHVICLDSDHKSFIQRHFPAIISVHMLPLGGFSKAKNVCNIENFLQRDYDVVFTGSGTSIHELERMIAERYSKQDMTLIGTVIEFMLSHRSQTFKESLYHVLTDNGYEADNLNFFLHAAAHSVIALFYTRAYVRMEAIASLLNCNARIHIFGSGWETLQNRNPTNVTFHSSIPYIETVALYQKTKIVFNVMPWFKKGLHDRIPTAMLNGAAVCSDSNEFIDTYFKLEGRGQELLTFSLDHPSDIPELIEHSLLKPGELYQVAKQGAAKAEASLTWEVQARKLAEIIELYSGCCYTNIF